LLPLIKLGGQGENNTLLLHGFGADRLSWTGNAAALFPHACVFAVDLPGHGQADIGEYASVSSMAKAVAASINHHQLDKLHLVGHSLGGAVAIEIAAQQPLLVSALSLLSPAGFGEGINRTFLDEYPKLSAPEAVVDLLQSLVLDQRLISSMIAPMVLAHLERPGVRSYLRSVATHLTGMEEALQPAIQLVVKSGVRRQIIWGDTDTINPPELSCIADFGGEVHWLENCGHLPHIEKRNAVNELLVRFGVRL
jgi:pyruvate dehydrogenase E2 component (dihydrolipoamide acetyltransferase)